MNLPPEFRFSQASLQDYADCPRRFELRYIERQAWPALESEPALEHERQMQLGVQFHRLVHQHQVGMDPALLEAAVRDPELQGWWRSYLDHPAPGLPEQRRPEYALTTPLRASRLLAKFDLLAYEPGGRFVIVDWKTNRKPARREWLSGRLQTLVYRFVLAEAGAHLNRGPAIDPARVSLVYWFAAQPDSPQVFEYSAAEHEAAREDLAGRVETIISLQAGEFPLAEEETRCRFCPYRSLCGRGAAAGRWEEWGEAGAAEPLAFDLDLEQVAEIEF